MSLAIAVYCSSSRAVDSRFLDASRELGLAIAERGHRLVYGGADIGCMGELARAAHAAGGAVTGVIPEYLANKGMDFSDAEELVVTRNMADRKALMEERADAFIVLPGGFGTLEELIQAITLKQLHYHEKAIVIVNLDGFYEPLLRVFDHLVEGHFAKPFQRQLYQVVTSVADALTAVETYRHIPPEDKWF